MLEDAVVVTGLAMLVTVGDETSTGLFTALPNEELPNGDATGDLLNVELPKMFAGGDSVFCGTSGEQMFADNNDFMLSAGLL